MRAMRAVVGAAAFATFAATAIAARRQEVSEAETRWFRWFNEAPDQLSAPAWLITQCGSLGAVFATAGVLDRRRGRSDALVVAGVGTGVWMGTKLVKPLIGRGRPADVLDGAVVRGQPQRGLGYPSGHASVSMTLAVMVSRDRARVPALALAFLTGSCRMYSGAHLPLDVGGGLAVGVLVGTAAAAR